MAVFMFSLTIHSLISLETLATRENIEEIVGFLKTIGMQM